MSFKRENIFCCTKYYPYLYRNCTTCIALVLVKKQSNILLIHIYWWRYVLHYNLSSFIKYSSGNRCLIVFICRENLWIFDAPRFMKHYKDVSSSFSSLFFWITVLSFLSLILLKHARRKGSLNISRERMWVLIVCKKFTGNPLFPLNK